MKNKKQHKKHRNNKFLLRNFSKKQKIYQTQSQKKGKDLKNAKSNVKIFKAKNQSQRLQIFFLILKFQVLKLHLPYITQIRFL